MWTLVSRGRWWIFGLLIPVAVLTNVAYLAGGAAAVAVHVAVHVVGAVLIAAGAWWALILRILRVFPQNMRLAASHVLRRAAWSARPANVRPPGSRPACARGGVFPRFQWKLDLRFPLKSRRRGVRSCGIELT
ncbi:hypothetical protein [Saccharopolyspora pogona]|uniref:hypothetical protein n=1 Tax=Saccharopolyspora pogona TaxID=333966 RepID=UPI00168672C0|nr:hypothetical protein [Saccharopolyspora pogona]